MKILFVSYSRTGNTRKVTNELIKELKQRGHEVSIEKIELEKEIKSRSLLILDLKITVMYFWGLIFKKDVLPRMKIKPITYPDVSEFDRVCITTPKWGSAPPHICKYLDDIQGLEGKKVGVFGTYYCPPYKNIEVKALFGQIKKMIEKKNGEVVVMMASTSDFLEKGIKSFKGTIWLLNLVNFGKPFPKEWKKRSPYFISDEFKPIPPYNEEAIKSFCNKVEE